MCGYDGTTCQLSTAPPAVLESLLQRTFGSIVTVQNNGVPGTIINQDLNGSSLQPLTPRLMASSAQIVIENFGLNDAVKVTPEAFRNDLNTWISAVQATGKTPILEEPNPTRSGSPVTDAIVAVINDVALQRGVTVIKQYDYIRTLPNWQSMLVDNLHPGPQLYAIKAQREYDVLAPIVKAMQ
jgi:lysophospholipase L1-like esterase